MSLATIWHNWPWAILGGLLSLFGGRFERIKRKGKATLGQFSGDAEPHGVLEVKGKLSPVEARRLARDWCAKRGPSRPTNDQETDS